MTGPLVALAWRASRWRLVAWPLTVAGVLTGTAAGVIGLYPTADDRSLYAATVGQSAATAALNGRGNDLDTLGGIAAYEFGFIASLGLPIVAGHLAIHLTRTPEDRGLLDLLSAGPVGRRQPLGAALVVLALTVSATGLLGAAGLVATGLPIEGSLRYATGLSLLLALFAAIGALAAQVATNARTATALLLAAVGGTYLARAVVDGRQLSATWLTPTGWVAEARPFGPGAWWPLMALTAATAVIGGSAVVVAGRRDLGAGIVAARNGPPQAAPWIRSTPALIHRLTRGSFLGWLAGAGAWGTTMGLLAPEMRSLVGENGALAEALGAGEAGPGGDDVIDLLAAMGLLVTSLLATGALVQWVSLLATEESSGRLAAITAAPVPRWRWWGGAHLVVALQATIVLAIGAVAQVVGTGLIDDTWAPGLLGDAAAYVPAVLLVGTLAGAAQANRPGGAALGWAVLGWVTVVALLGQTLGLPEVLRRTSPFELVGRLPVDAASPAVLGALVVAVGVLAAAALVGLSRRDLAA